MKEGLAALEERLLAMRTESEFSGFDEVQPVSLERRTRVDIAPAESLSLASSWHELRLVLASRFMANKAEYPTARKHAERLLAQCLYSDVLRELDVAIADVGNGQRRAALKRLCDLRENLTR